MPNNLQYCMCLTDPNPKQSQGYRAAILKNSRWQPGDVISVRFLDGDPALQDRVRKVAKEWTKVANLTFDFVDAAPSDIRIAFAQGNGSWSYIGTVCRSIPEPQPTMNYGWLTTDSDETELRRVVLHEFGHAIGLIHEHQNPKGGIHWNKSAVIRDLSGPPNNWSEATIENNMFKFYPLTDVIPTDVDDSSIMMYPIPQSWTTDGFSAGLNGELSDNDRSLVASVYPK
jgi:serralysin